MMTRKDYVKTAAILNGNRPFIDPPAFTDLVNEFIEMFASDNERFDIARFVNATEGKKQYKYKGF